MQTEEHKKGLAKFQTLNNPLPFIGVLSLILILFVCVWILLIKSPFDRLGIRLGSGLPFDQFASKKLLFIFYLCIFSSWWFVYFSSKWAPKWEPKQTQNDGKNVRGYLQVRTLRRLLLETSEHWAEAEGYYNQKEIREAIDSLHQKSQSSMTALAMMVAASLLVGREVLVIINSDKSPPRYLWDFVIVGSAGITGFLAFICFIISADALDSLVNKFKNEEFALKNYFYRKTINPKYSGFIFLILEVIFLTAYYSLIFSCMLLGLTMSIGYTYWFPGRVEYTSSGHPRIDRKGVAQAAWIIGFILIIPPLLLELFTSSMIPATSYAIASALLWALSAPIIKRGLDRIPNEQKVLGVLSGLLISLLSGSIFLLLFLIPYMGSWETLKSWASLLLIVAGVFTFPVGTGLYYLCGNAYNNKMELASQFARVKPFFSLLFAVWLLEESLSLSLYISGFLIFMGIVLLIYGTWQGAFKWRAVILGLLTALFWSMGEVSMKKGLKAPVSIIDTFMALVSGTIVFTVLFGGYILVNTLRGKKYECKTTSWIGAFITHGIMSFGLGYAAFFESIKQIGLGQSILINAFWPILAIIFSRFDALIRGEEYNIPRIFWVAAISLLIGSIIAAIWS